MGPCAVLDVRDDAVTACVRRPELHGREQEARVFTTFAPCLGELRDWLAAEAATRVAVDATGAHWRPVWHMLEALEGVELVLVNAHHVKTLPGGKAGVGDACWLAQLLEYELLCAATERYRSRRAKPEAEASEGLAQLVALFVPQRRP